MVERIGAHFPLDWPYGNDELYIINKTHEQIKNHFPNQRNLLINTTWFGSQFDNDCWTKAMNLEGEFDNLFLLCVIDPEYLFAEDLQKIINKYQIKNVHRIGMYEGEPFEWNFHAIIANDRMPE